MRLRGDARFNPSYQQLTDLSGVTEIRVSTGTINETSLDQFFAPGTRRAIVATDSSI